jgi:tRNA dimethylallyltransferase
MQVYRHMDVGTAKPSREERDRLRHHMVDVADPSEQFNAGRFVKAAEQLVSDIVGRGKVPVVSGGTAFYITSFLFGLPESPPVDPAVRERLKERAGREGTDQLYRSLLEKDPGAGAKIQPKDSYRTLRALEVLESTGRSLFSYHWPRTPRTDFRAMVVGLERERAELYRRINDRVERMFDNGLLAEVKALLAMGFGPEDPGMRGIGYRELLQMRAGCETLRGTRDRIAQNTRRYAKRQITFFRTVPGVQWVHPSHPADLREKIEAFIAGST